MNLMPITLMMLLAGGPANPNAPASIGGMVVKAETNAPAINATVRIFRFVEGDSPIIDSKPLPRPEKTDKNGRFVFDKVPPGSYRIDVDRSADVAVTSDRSLGSPPRGTPVTVAAGERVRDLRIEVTPASSISGRVVDRKGKPAEGITIMAVTPSYENARRLLHSSVGGGGLRGTAKTNRRGEYQITGLAPGQYYVTANNAFGIGGWGPSAPDWCDWNLQVGNTTLGVAYNSARLDMAFRLGGGLVSYFPGVRDPAEAMPIDVHINTERSHVDFKVEDTSDNLTPSTMHGNVVDAATGKRITQSEVWITPLDGSSRDSCLIQAEKGSFETFGLRPGKYAVSANIESPVPMAGRITIDSSVKTPKNVTIPVAPLLHVRGRIVVEGESEDSQHVDLSSFFVNLQPDPNVNSARLAFAPVSRDGTFEVQNLMGWDYRVSLRSPVPNSYIQSIRLGEVDILSNGFHLESQPTAELKIVIRKDSGAVAGVTTKPDRNPAAVPLNVVLVPDPARRSRQDLYRTATLNEKGQFEMNGLPPGDYRLFAWEHVTDGAWTDPEFLRLYEDQGTPVRITAGATASAAVTPIAPWK